MDLEHTLRREWLETNGIGGYASSTLAGLHTRRYHGLLVAATHPPVGRMVLLSKLEETLVIAGERYELGANRYPGVVHPRGHEYLAEFRRDPCATFVYRAGGCELEKSVFMVQGDNTTVVRYAFRGKAAARLEVRALVACRDYHCTAHANSYIHPEIEIGQGYVKQQAYDGAPPLYVGHEEAEVRAAGDWYYHFEFDRERERGLDFVEDLFHPFDLVFDLARNPRPVLTASTEPGCRRFTPPAAAEDPLDRAANQFIVRRGNGHSTIAGYHWFSDWGRDTMIALPGLTLATGRPEIAKSILREFAAHTDRGMLPNRFPDAAETPEYNTVDATLWFFEAVRALGDAHWARENLYAAMADIIAWHERGTRYGIHMDADGLLCAGAPGVQLTWMDAKVGDWVVTPRRGKPVEIQALWYNALRIMQELAPDGGAHYQALADRAAQSFLPLFWNEAAGCLYDVVDGDGRDGSIRPNQIFAVSLSHRLVPQDKAARILQVVREHLLTPYGLRSLSPSDPQYRGRYTGDPRSRDGAYHQGTVWPWLIGPFITAWQAVHGGEAPQAWLAELQRYMLDEGVGQIPEVFDGDAPHRPGGCIAQAWSVGELLRVQA
jgi:glycogen debranching enzyme